MLNWTGVAGQDTWYNLRKAYDKYIPEVDCILSWWCWPSYPEPDSWKPTIVGYCPENRNLDDLGNKRVILGYMCLKVIPIMEECGINYKFTKSGVVVYVSLDLDSL